MNRPWQTIYDRLVLAAALLAFCVVVLGAYVRLSDAGLGCPDWPGCYGHMTVPHAEVAQQAFPERPLEAHKAWKEMAHRYLAGTLGLLVLCICVVSWRGKRQLRDSPWLPSVLLVLVVCQALLGMWTVTLLLKPAIVSLHLVGGMSTLALLAWLTLRRFDWHIRQATAVKLRPWAGAALLLLACQIVLGGWASSNYAALACSDLPQCQGAWVPEMDFAHAFHPWRELGMDANGGQLSGQALTAIHWMHRLGALLTLLLVGSLAIRLLRFSEWRVYGALLSGLLLMQVTLGISNVLLGLPLLVAVGHNAGAALLLVCLVLINSRLWGERLKS